MHVIRLLNTNLFGQCGTASDIPVIQWNLSNTNMLGTKLFSELSLFQGENNMCLHVYLHAYEVVTQSSVLINQGVLLSEVFFKRDSTVAYLMVPQCTFFANANTLLHRAINRERCVGRFTHAELMALSSQQKRRP